MNGTQTQNVIQELYEYELIQIDFTKYFASLRNSYEYYLIANGKNEKICILSFVLISLCWIIGQFFWVPNNATLGCSTSDVVFWNGLLHDSFQQHHLRKKPQKALGIVNRPHKFCKQNTDLWLARLKGKQ